MNKLIFVILAALIVFLPVSVFAENVSGTTTLVVDYSLELEDTVIISGVAENIPSNATITVTVFKSGNTLENLSGTGVSDISVISAVEKLSLNEDYSWTFNWEPTESGNYDIYVSSKFFENPVKTSCYLAANRTTVINTIINGSKEELETLFENSSNIKAVIIDTALYENTENTSKIGEIIHTLRQEFETDAEILNLLPLSCILAGISENPTYELMDNAVLELSRINKSLANEELYNKSTEAIRNEVANKLSDKTDNTISELDKLFTEALILSGVEKNTNYVSVIDYLALLEDKTYETNKTAAAQAVVGKTYTMPELISALEIAVTPVVTTKPGSSGGGGGGGSRGGSTAITGTVAPAEVKTETAPAEKQELFTFNDVPGTHWAFDAINNLRWKDIVSGNEKGEFLPENHITRAEIVKMICELYNISSSLKASYEDVTENHWAYKYISAATANNIVMGDGNCFNPDEFISRQDLATIIYRVSVKYGITYTETEVSFTDDESIAEYAKEAVAKLSSNGILKGKGNDTFEPVALTTRAEAAAVIYRLMNNTEVE